MGDSPSISVVPSLKPSLSIVPSASPSLSQTPSLNPTVSQAPSDSPSISVVPSQAFFVDCTFGISKFIAKTLFKAFHLYKTFSYTISIPKQVNDWKRWQRRERFQLMVIFKQVSYKRRKTYQGIECSQS